MSDWTEHYRNNVPEGTIIGHLHDYEDWLFAQQNIKLKIAGQEIGKNSIFKVVFDSMRYLADIVNTEQKARIVFDYDPDVRNWVMTVFIDKDAPMPNHIR